MKCKLYIEEIIEKLLKDERIILKKGTINSYSRYSYKKKGDSTSYEEVLQVGFKISVLLNKYSDDSTWINLYVWTDNNENKVFIKNSLYDEIKIIEKQKQKKIINTIVGLILEKEINNNLRDVVNL